MPSFSTPLFLSLVFYLLTLAFCIPSPSLSNISENAALLDSLAPNQTITCTRYSETEVVCEGESYKVSEHYIRPGSFLFYMYILIVIGLVMTAGLMSGLTMGLLSLDTLSLNVIKNGGDKVQSRHASKILPIVKQHHLLLVCLLLCNAGAMEALPIFLDRLLSPVAAVLISVTLVLFFGEIIPQAVCTRFGLAIGAHLSLFVRLIMCILYPIAKPVSMILDYLLGHDSGTFYRRAELKELVYLHGQMASGDSEANDEPLSKDEITIIKGALDLAKKNVLSIMTPLDSVCTLEDTTILDSHVMQELLEMGHSRIPIYSGSKSNIIGVLSVKTLIHIDPADRIPISDVYLFKIPEVPPQMMLYDILNEFQTGKSHIAAVRETDPETGMEGDVLGIVTLEDVIEELIGEEIIDETDVYVDVAGRIKVARLLRKVSSKLPSTVRGGSQQTEEKETVSKKSKRKSTQSALGSSYENLAGGFNRSVTNLKQNAFGFGVSGSAIREKIMPRKQNHSKLSHSHANNEESNMTEPSETSSLLSSQSSLPYDT